MEKDRKIILILILIIAILAVGMAYMILAGQHGSEKSQSNNTTVKNTTANNTTVKNTTLTKKTNGESGKYGYCAICGRALSASEAGDEYTQGKVCSSCARDPYYQSGEGARYANEKLIESYPEDYEWMYQDTPSSSEYDYSYDDGGYEEY